MSSPRLSIIEQTVSVAVKRSYSLWNPIGRGRAAADGPVVFCTRWANLSYAGFAGLFIGLASAPLCGLQPNNLRNIDAIVTFGYMRQSSRIETNRIRVVNSGVITRYFFCLNLNPDHPNVSRSHWPLSHWGCLKPESGECLCTAICSRSILLSASKIIAGSNRKQRKFGTCPHSCAFPLFLGEWR